MGVEFIAIETTQLSQESTVKSLDWEPPTPPTDLVFDDGEPLESNRHRIASENEVAD
ncbi:hypothetical protein DSM107007_26860 [Nostoc sp. PCC 7120 = FACHB-418]|nr:hypothetical protein DSM107007_26860 [Nostoc sp. PCC 7120 = FACHB-418]